MAASQRKDKQSEFQAVFERFDISGSDSTSESESEEQAPNHDTLDPAPQVPPSLRKSVDDATVPPQRSPPRARTPRSATAKGKHASLGGAMEIDIDTSVARAAPARRTTLLDSFLASTKRKPSTSPNKVDPTPAKRRKSGNQDSRQEEEGEALDIDLGSTVQVPVRLGSVDVDDSDLAETDNMPTKTSSRRSRRSMSRTRTPKPKQTEPKETKASTSRRKSGARKDAATEDSAQPAQTPARPKRSRKSTTDTSSKRREAITNETDSVPAELDAAQPAQTAAKPKRQRKSGGTTSRRHTIGVTDETVPEVDAGSKVNVFESDVYPSSSSKAAAKRRQSVGPSLEIQLSASQPQPQSREQEQTATNASTNGNESGTTHAILEPTIVPPPKSARKRRQSAKPALEVQVNNTPKRPQQQAKTNGVVSGEALGASQSILEPNVHPPSKKARKPRQSVGSGLEIQVRKAPDTTTDASAPNGEEVRDQRGVLDSVLFPSLNSERARKRRGQSMSALEIQPLKTSEEQQERRKASSSDGAQGRRRAKSRPPTKRKSMPAPGSKQNEGTEQTPLDVQLITAAGFTIDPNAKGSGASKPKPKRTAKKTKTPRISTARPTTPPANPDNDVQDSNFYINVVTPKTGGSSPVFLNPDHPQRKL
ncbi:hypothetical protein KEM55_003556, partial [Ascosphaera atra]